MASLANGSRQPVPTARANIGYAACTRMGVALVIPGDCPVLVGIDFLRIFNLGLAMTHEALCLAPVADLGRFVETLALGPQESRLHLVESDEASGSNSLRRAPSA